MAMIRETAIRISRYDDHVSWLLTGALQFTD
jgi:hypothetical protein